MLFGNLFEINVAFDCNSETFLKKQKQVLKFLIFIEILIMDLNDNKNPIEFFYQ